jgi:uncharacterized protein
MTIPVVDETPTPKENTETILPWSVDDTWIGVGLLVVIQVALALTVLVSKPPKVYGSIIVIFLELVYIIPALIILSLRHASFGLLGYRKFDSRFIVIGVSLVLASYVVTLINNTLFVTFGKDIQADEIQKLLNSLSSPYAFIFTGVIIAPFVEESFFRGFLFAGFRQRYGYQKAAILSSAIFAAAHLQISVLVPTFLLG